MSADRVQIKTDKELVDRMLAGEEEAFENFFERSFDGLFRFALTRVDYNEELAEEMAQAAIYKAIEKLDTYCGEAALFRGKPLAAEQTLFAGSEISTREGRVAFRLVNGTSARLDRLSTVKLISADVIVLEEGAVYLDSGAAGAPGGDWRCVPLGVLLVTLALSDESGFLSTPFHEVILAPTDAFPDGQRVAERLPDSRG